MLNDSPLDIYERVVDTLPTNYLRSKNKGNPEYHEENDDMSQYQGDWILQHNQNHNFENFPLPSDNYVEFETELEDPNYVKEGRYFKGDLFKIVNNGFINDRLFLDGDLIYFKRDVEKRLIKSRDFRVYRDSEKELIRSAISIYSDAIGYTKEIFFTSPEIKVPIDFTDYERVVDESENQLYLDEEKLLKERKINITSSRNNRYLSYSKTKLVYYADLKYEPLDTPLPRIFDAESFEKIIRYKLKIYTAEHNSITQGQNTDFTGVSGESAEDYQSKLDELIKELISRAPRVPFISRK